MFTGIIEALGTVTNIRQDKDNLIFSIHSPISRELRPDQSVSHNGACLTVTAIDHDRHQVIAVAETLQKTNLGTLKPGDQINLERSLTLQKFIDGHLVQGHVDTTGKCLQIANRNGSTEFRIRFPEKFAHLIIEKGSIALNGISLTVFSVTENEFTVAVIPYTFEHTTMHLLRENDIVNLEFDLIGKYVTRLYKI
ncbi:MAG: riboflavin synthase [Chitinophagaceae bacterium]|jgi:riboflavin synthase|nr:MAG: riboflavin synthase [Chitinophagaceae bacterium]